MTEPHIRGDRLACPLSGLGEEIMPMRALCFANGIGDQAERTFDELRGAQSLVAPLSSSQLVAQPLVGPHIVAPHWPIISRIQRCRPGIAKRLKALRLHADQRAPCFDPSVEPGMSTTSPGKAGTILYLYPRRDLAGHA